MSQVSFTTPPATTSSVGVAPLVDIVLLLICFYLIVARVAADQDDTSIELPIVTTELPAANETPPLVINLREDGTLTALDAPLDDRGLARLLENNLGDTRNVVIRADARATWADLATLQEAASRAGFQTLTLRTTPAEEPAPMEFNPPAAPETPDEALNLTSMVDVVFILLAFFVLTARFIGPEQDLVTNALADTPAAQAIDLPDSVTITLGPDAADASSITIRLGQNPLPTNDFADLTERLRALAPAQLPVYIDADPALRVDVITRTIDAVLQTHLTEVSLVPPQ